MRVTYSTNNSGGSYWLTGEDWVNLEDAGWVVEWEKPRDDEPFAYSAYIDNVESVDVAVAKWEHVTKERAADPGCSCCGPPHSFYADQGGYWDGRDEDDDDDWNW